jgi:hypothetical protein
MHLPLNDFYLFPVYATREEYRRATGQDAPAYNPSRAPKHWLDPKAAASPRRTVVYDLAVQTGDQGQPLADKQGKPIIDVLLLPRDEAASVNIWEPGNGLPAPAMPRVEPPLREPAAGQEFTFVFPGIVGVLDRAAAQASANYFTPADRALLQAIAKKLAVA